jgi:excisionase family DNA binding protein
MSRQQRHCPRDPVGLSIEEAAAFLGVSSDLFQRAVDDGSMPHPRKLFGRLIWDADEIAVAFRRLPRKGGAQSNDNDGGRWQNLKV